MSSTIRVERRERFSIVDRRALTDPRLSFKAKGILAYIIGFPDGATVNRDDLATMGPDGEKSIRSGLKELVDAGYLVRQKVRRPGGQMVTESVLYEYPPEAGNRPPVPEAGNGPLAPVVGNRPPEREEEPQEEQPSLSSDESDGDVETAFYRKDGLPVAAESLPFGKYPKPFEVTWLVYPPNRRVEKRGAYKKWRATVEREVKASGQSVKDVMLMLYRAVFYYAQTVANKEPQFIKHPATFFGPAEPWRDYLVKPATPPALKDWET